MDKPAVLAIIVFVVMWYGIAYVHELAHAGICELSGHQSRLHIIFTGEARAVTCSGPPDNINLYRAIGGLVGMAVSGVIALVFKTHKTVLAASLPFVPTQALNAWMETFAYRWYIDPANPIPSFVLSTLVICLFLGLLFYFKIVPASKKARTDGNKVSE